MAFLRKSLSQDAVDRYCDTWAFLFLSLLAINFLFLPLAPSMSFTVSPPPQEAQHPRNQNVFQEVKMVRYPKYKAECWTPAHFPLSLEIYAESVCSSVINSLAQGKEFSAAGLYEPLREGVDASRTGVLTKEDFWPSGSYSMTPNDDQDQTRPQSIDPQNQREMESLRHDRDKFLSGTRKLFLFKTPLFLLVFAICLRLPHAIWALFSTCCGCMNVDKTLSSAQQMRSLDAAGNRKIREELSVTLRKSTRKSLCLLYLLMKLLMFVVLLAGFKVNHDMVIEIDTLENDWSRLKLTNEDNKGNRVMASVDGHPNSSSPDTRQSSSPPYDGSVLLCDFSSRVATHIQRYTVQCVFTADQSSGRSTSRKTLAKNREATTRTQMNHPDYDNILLMYKCLFTIVLSLLIVLIILTVGSLVTWLVKLLLPSCRPSMGLKGEEALDVVFIVAMAWMNTSSTVAMELAKCTAKCTAESDKQQSEGDAFELN